MSQTWYVKHSGKTVGPITSSQLKQLVSSGKVNAATEVRLGGDGRWITAGKIKGLIQGSTPRQVQMSSEQDRSAPPQPSRPEDSSQTKPAQKEAANPYQSTVSSENDRPTHAVAETQPITPTKSDNESGLAKAFWGIWLRPRKTIRWVIDHRPARDSIFLVMIAFSVKFLDNAISSQSYSLVYLLIMSVIGIPVSAMIGVLVLYAIGFLQTLVGEALGGVGDSRSLRTAFAWSTLPVICGFPVTLVFLVLIYSFPTFLSLPDLILNTPLLILFAWGIIIQVAGISAAHKFSILRAVFTFFLSIVIVGLAMGIAVQGAIMVTT